MSVRRTSTLTATMLGVALSAWSVPPALAGDPHVDGNWHARFDARLSGIHAILMKNGDVLLLFAARAGTQPRRKLVAGNPDAVVLKMDYSIHPDAVGPARYATPTAWDALQMNEIESNDPLDLKYSCPGPGSPEELEYNWFCSWHAQMADGRLLFVGGNSDPYNPANACCDEETGETPEIDGHNLTAIFDPALAQSPNDPWIESIDDMWDPADPSEPWERWYHTCTALGRGRIFMTAGRTNDCKTEWADYPAVFDSSAPSGQQWTHYTNNFESRMPIPAETPQPPYPFMFLRTTGELFLPGSSPAYTSGRRFSTRTATRPGPICPTRTTN